MKSAARKLKRRVIRRKAYAAKIYKKKAGVTSRRLASMMKARWALAPARTKHRDRVLEQFDRGEDVFEFCDMSAGVMKVPLD